MNVKQYISKHYIAIINFIGIVTFLIFAYACVFARPCGDDLLNSVGLYRIIKTGNFTVIDLLIEAIKHDIEVCKTFQTTYVSNFFFAIQAGIFGNEYYSLSILSILLISVVCIYYLQSAIFAYLDVKTNKITTSIVLFMILFCGMPSIVCGLYWYVGAFHYVTFFFLCLLNIGLVVNYCNYGKTKYIVLSALLSFIISGGNQVTALLNTASVFLILLAYIKTKPLIAISAISGFVGCCINAFSTGSQNRLALFSSNTSIIETGIDCIAHSRDIIFEWMDSRIIFALIITALFSVAKAKAVSTKFQTNPLLILVGMYMLFVSTLFVPHYALGSWGPRRIVNVQWMTYVITSMFFVYYTITWIKSKKIINVHYKDSSFVYSCAQIVCVLCVLGMVGSNALKVVYELRSGMLREYSTAYDNRINSIIESDNDIVYVEALPESEVLLYGDISSDYSTNEYLFEIYGKKVALISEDAK